MPKRNLYKCKQCGHETDKKESNWQHMRIHVKPEKLLVCNLCEFVTQYKHHLEYHKMNHAGIRPYKCESCDYCCLNRSMLNSHLKSHSSIYPHQCGDCEYVSRYLHSLKQHQKKYNHYRNSSCPPGSEPPSSGPPSSAASSTTQEQPDILDLRVNSKFI